MKGEFSTGTSELASYGDMQLDQVLALAERFQQASGMELDDSAIQAVAEACSVPEDYVRMAVKMRTDRQQPGLVQRVRGQFLTLDPKVRRWVASLALATNVALFSSLAERFNLIATALQSKSSLGPVFDMISMVLLFCGFYNAVVSRDKITAFVSGAVFGAFFVFTQALFRFIVQVPNVIEPTVLVLYTILGGVTGLGLWMFVDKFRKPFGMKDPAAERKELLQQLVDIQDKLKQAEQYVTFLSVDVAGSTKMKELASPLAIEYTFGEYHQFIMDITHKFGGEIHSTAGDGLTCAFDAPQQAYAAARNMQAGLFELNNFRNKTGIPIRIRCGIHTGTALVPNKDDIGSVSFSHVIDIAAHMQKECPIGGIAVSETAIQQLPMGAASVGDQTFDVNGIKAYIWQPKTQPKPTMNMPGAPELKPNPQG
ncbi:MAG: adenylate/guanylate cyclase domain-containing protein [Armatimonadetes bacterium]|nr:adenylate/guanylate cyclase domain-containing protein [Armatimonadota bacterium]